MKDYNGFSGKQRERAQRWLNKEWTAGRLARPSECVACGQTYGVIQAHAEDYSEPFRAGVTDGFHLCIICHAAVHARSKSPKAWRDYRALVEAGGRAKVMKSNQNFLGATTQFVSRPITADMFDWGSPPARRALLEIEVSQDDVAECAKRIHETTREHETSNEPADFERALNKIVERRKDQPKPQVIKK